MYWCTCSATRAEVTHRSTYRAAQSARLPPLGARTHQRICGSGGAIHLGDHGGLDRFKQVNDTQGHATGDRILVAVADELRHATRGRAVARVGGEEFLIAEMTQPGEAQAIAERLRQEFAAIPWGATASVGIASIGRVNAADSDARAVIEHLVDAADAAMYEAKRAGGNRTRQAESAEITAPGLPPH